MGSQEALDVNFVKEEILCYSSHGDNQTQASKLLVKLVEICREAHVPDSYTGIICQMILTRSEAESLEWAKNVSTDTVAWFLLRVFLRIGASSDIAIVALDDISYMDELSWKFVELLFDHSKHTIILGTSRPVTSNDANIYGDFWSRLNRREYERRFAHVRLLSMQQSDVNRLIASKLGIELHAVNSDIASEIFVKSGGRPALVIEIFQKSFSKTIEAAKNPTILKFKVCTCVSKNFQRGFLWLTSYNLQSSDEVKNGDNISDHILQQLDALPSEVQILLNLLALLGSSFELLHVVTIMEEYNGVKENDKLPHADSILLNLDVAVEEGILIAENEAGHPTDHPGIRRNIIFRFSHDLWRKSILKLSLEDWKRKMQTIILDSRGQDTTLLLELLPLWTVSAARNESMEILLKICDKLALAGRHEQCIKLLGAELENHKIDEHAALDDDVFNFIVLLHVAMGKSYMALLVFDSSRESFLSGLKVRVLSLFVTVRKVLSQGSAHSHTSVSRLWSGTHK